MTARKTADPPPRALPRAIVALGHAFSTLPGIGEKTGLRHALHVATGDMTFARAFAAILDQLHTTVARCVDCGGLADRAEEGESRCAVCADPRRLPTMLCVVWRVPDMLAIERAGAMRGRYFILGKLLSPLDGNDGTDLPLAELRARCAGVEEVLIATPPSVEGEATSLYLAKTIAGWGGGLRITRLASGIAHGADLEFADQITLTRAIDGRSEISA